MSDSEISVVSGNSSSGSEDDELRFGTLDITEFNYRVNMGIKFCTCVEPSNDRSCLGLMLELSNEAVIVENINCMLNSLISCCNYALDNFKELSNPFRLAFADNFYKMRHEVLFKLVMKSLNLPNYQSDIKFSEFGIESNRTPDYIKKDGDNFTILEIGVTSNFEKTAMMKGLQSSGYESKYKKEIDLMLGKGYLVNYIPIIFDMTSYNSDYHVKLIKSLNSIFHINNYFLSYLSLCYKEFCTITYNLKDYLSPVSPFLFMDFQAIEKQHEDLQFLYTNSFFDPGCSYKKMTVSSQVYNKINTLWHRVIEIYERSDRTLNNKMEPVINISNNRLSFEGSTKGFTYEEIKDLVSTNDKPLFFSKLMLKTGNVKFPALGSETGFDFIDRVEKTSSELETPGYNIPYLLSHKRVTVERAFKGMKRYKYIVSQMFSTQFNPVFYDKDYESLMIKKIHEDDLVKTDKHLHPDFYVCNERKDLLCNNDLGQLDITKKFVNIIKRYEENNDFKISIPIKIRRMKQPFILPIADLNKTNYSSLKNKNVGLYEQIYKSLKSNEYTKTILIRIIDDDFSFSTDSAQPSQEFLSLKNSKYELCNKMTFMHKKMLNEYKLAGISSKDAKLKTCHIEGIKEDYITLSRDISRLDREIDRMARSEGIKQSINMLRLPTKNKKTFLGSYFQEETAHFKSKKSGIQSTIEGVGLSSNYKDDYKKISETMVDLCGLFTEYRGDNPDLLIDLNPQKDSKLLFELKVDAKDAYCELISEIKDSFIGHASAFISRLGHSLMFYSQLPFDSNYIRADNLGYDNVLLLVRGGKKIFKTKSSKMFRLLFPIHQSMVNLYIDESVGYSNFIHLPLDEGDFILTPWMMLHESILSDTISFYPRVCSFMTLNSDPSKDFKSQFHNYFLNVILAFHNRRQTEVFLANMRYILFSTMGDYSGIMDIFEDFCGFNYDKVQFFIRTSIMLNYVDFFKKMRVIQADPKANEGRINTYGVKNLFTGRIMENTESLTLMIYSTFLMTKGPYQRPAERAINLLGILKIHKQFDEEVGLTLSPADQLNKISSYLTKEKSYSSYVDELFKNDFMIDPYYCTNLGVFANSYFENLGLRDKFQTEWVKILNKEWDSMATSTGLRGNYKDVEDFWGKKGYFVIYKFLFKDSQYLDNLLKIFNANLDDNSKQSLVKNLNQTFLSKMKLLNSGDLIFHAVDKVQWRGSREIYVMDLDTKIMQQPIEKMMAFLCKNIDNELISIPTDKRSQVIHHTIFEKDLPLKDALTWFLTLDCSKWAPKSMFVKFCLMMLAMPVLPPTFVVHFMNYIEKLYYKRIYFNVAEVEVLKNNIQYKGLIDEFLIKDEILNGYYLLMPYSWVMGIFNYTSSFMHAFNQKYAAYIVNKTSSLSYGEETTLVMFAHSDDSGGRISSVNKNLITRGLFLYEVQLKACNHLLSKKKSVVSRIYFEVLSIIYLFNKLMALLPKFLGGLRFTPSDKGPAHDMLQSYSKCIEVIVAGADFRTAYLVMKFFATMVWRFYYNKKPLPEDSLRPVQYFGFPDAHPLMVLLTGSDSDTLRLISTKETKVTHVIHKFISDINLNFDDEGIIRPLKFNIKVRNIQKGFSEYIEELGVNLDSWTLGNVNFKNTAFNTFNFLKKLNDPGFVGSLVNETPVRRISRAYYLRKGDSVITSKGNFDLSSVMSSVRLITDYVTNKSEGSSLSVIGLMSDEFIKSLDELINQDELETNTFKIFYNILAGPIKLNQYFDRLSLENKDYRVIKRTLKPTQLQLLKTGSSFSVNFDASQLVSYIKEPEFRWALPDLKNLPTVEKELQKLMDFIGIKIDDIDESTLLKLIRMHVTKTSKDIYLYSQVPGEIRTIKTYAAMLLFLSTNSIKNIEIAGLTLKLKDTLTDPGYLENSINEDIYYLNTLCSIILTLMKGDYELDIASLTINGIEFIKWAGGSLYNFIDFIEEKKYHILDFNYISLYVNYIKEGLYDSKEVSTCIVKGTCYYIFLKDQKRKGGWYGKGQLMIVIDKEFYIYNLLGNNIESVESNHRGKIDPTAVSFINDTLRSCGINTSANYFLNNNKINTEMAYGYDHLNEMSISIKREISRGVPFNYIKRNPLFINQLDFGTIRHVRENVFICTFQINEEIRTYKLYGLKINKTNVIDVIKSMFNKADFEKHLITNGIKDLNEFILTEVLTDFQEDISIKKEEFFDAIFSSELYKSFKCMKLNNSNLLPKILKAPKLPAEEGSLTRILLKYGELINDTIIKSYKNYDPAMLSIRSEFPEGFSLILSEKLVESHRRIFNGEENSEMIKAYATISKTQDINKLKDQLIKLMCYWGYGSLVNAINIYDFSKKKENFLSIRVVQKDDISKSYCRQFYCELNRAILSTMDSFASLYDQLEKPIKGINENLSYNSMKKQYLKYLTFVGFGYDLLLNFIELHNVYFLNTLIGFLKIPEFCEQLTHNLSNSLLLNTLPIDYNYRKELISFLNTLKVIYFKTLNINYQLDYVSIIDRIPDNITQPISILNEFQQGFIKSNEIIYHHGFLNNVMIDKFKSNLKLTVKNAEGKERVYKIQQKISKLSETKVPVNSIIKFIRPLSEETIESDEWQDLQEELNFDPIDSDTIEELWGEIEQPYGKRETHFTKAEVRLKLHWVIHPFVEGQRSFLSKLRQIGENIVLVTTVNLNTEELYNCFQFITNFSSIAGGDLPDCFLYCMGNKALNIHFWNELLGENEVRIKNEQLDPLYLKSINTEFGMKDASDMGALSTTELLESDMAKLDEKIKSLAEKDEGESSTIKEIGKTKSAKDNLINERLEEAYNKGLINSKTKEKIAQKYTSLSTSKFNKIEDLLSSLLNEIDLNKLHDIFQGDIQPNLTKKQIINIFQTPEHFTLVQSGNRSQNNPLMNSKIRAELDSFCSGLSAKIASGTLTISHSKSRLFKASMKIWKTHVLATSYKKENKKFLLKLMNSIFNSAFETSDSEDDVIWQVLQDNTQVLIAQDEDDESSDDDSFIQFDYDIIDKSRLQYRFSGYT